jgi:hypothetical protein
LRDTISSTV